MSSILNVRLLARRSPHRRIALSEDSQIPNRRVLAPKMERKTTKRNAERRNGIDLLREPVMVVGMSR